MGKQFDDSDGALTEAEAAEYLGYTKAALNKWRVLGKGPRFVKVSAKSIRYMKSDLAQWLTERKSQSTAEGNSKVS